MIDRLFKRKPDWLYKIMPIIYFVAGLVVLFIFDSQPGYMVGSLLLLAAFLVWMMRNQNRA